MSRTSRLVLTAAAAATLAATGTANAAIAGTPEFILAPHTKAAPTGGTAVALSMRWQAVQFLGATANDHYEVRTTQLPLGSPQTYGAGTQTSLSPIYVSNGQPLRVEVGACQVVQCTFGGVGTAEAEHETMIDATPPTGTVTINGGAAATNDRNVSLAMTAADPLIEGRAGTSSGVTQLAVDQDGNGTFPCDFIIIGGGPFDTSGCARNFAPTATAQLTAGDGPKTVGVAFGDGAREPSVPCVGVFCVILLGSPILGNASASATDTILLDTVKPLARADRESLTIERGDSVTVDSAPSTDPGGANASGVDPATSAWDFADGTPIATGPRVTHAFPRIGTFVGTLRVKDRAGNLSDPRSISVTVTPRPGETIDGSGSVAGVTGSAAFALSRLSVRARYVRSRLIGAIQISGISSQPGTIVATIRRTARGKALLTARRPVQTAAFTRSIPLPATLLPGRYLLAFAGPGGTLSSTLTLTPPREGVVSSARVTLRGGPRARFAFAARPVPSLRSRLTVAWSQGRARLGTVAVGSGRVVTAGLPAGATAGRGVLRATLRAGAKVVAVASARVR